MALDFDTSSRFGLRALKGDNLVSDIDAGFLALAGDVGAIMAGKFAVLVGDGASTSIAVVHSLGSQDCVVSVCTAAAPYSEVDVEVQHTDANTVTLKFAVAPAVNAYKCVVIG